MYNGNLEWSLTIRDIQYDPAISLGPADLQTLSASIDAMLSAPLGESGTQYDARSVFDSRPLNAYDGIFSGNATATPDSPWEILFEAPLGYRVVPRNWAVAYDAPGTGPNSNSTVTLLTAESAVPYNSDIVIGPGTEDLESFYLVEEGSAFGMTGQNANIATTTTVYVNVRVNLIPVTLDQLPYSVVNRIPGT